MKSKINLKKELSASKSLLLLMPSIDYNKVIVDMAKQLSGKSICYVTLNKTRDSLEQLFKKNKINTSNIVFVDGISKSIKKMPDQEDRCYFVSSPGALTELSLVITKFLRHNFEYIIFDAITTLTIYEKKTPIIRFISSLINKIKESNTKAVFYAVNADDGGIIKESSMFVNKVIEI